MQQGFKKRKSGLSEDYLTKLTNIKIMEIIFKIAKVF